jgi:hypothetical protein
MKTKIIVSAVLVLALGIIAFSLFASSSSAQASAESAPSAQGTPNTQRTPNAWQETLAPVRETLQALPTQEPVDLESVLKREQLALSNQQVRLTLSHTVAGAAQDFIDSQKSAGKDTAALETALAAVNQKISEAEAANAQAAAILATPAGFDAQGHVTDRPIARQTVRSAGQSLRSAHLALKSGTLTLRQAMRAYRGK